jgi:hypothetical protein
MKISQRIKKQWDLFLSIVCLIILVALLAFCAGFFVADNHIFPLYQIKFATNSFARNFGVKLCARIFSEKHKKYPSIWSCTKEKEKGTVVYEPAQAYEGLTILSGNDTSAQLIDMEGNVVHKWQKNFFDVWPRPEHVKLLVDKDDQGLIVWDKVHLFPNGDLLAIYVGDCSFTPYGGGIIKVNLQSELLWKADINAHHDLSVDEDGRIFVLTHKYNYESDRPRIDDYITILSPEGKVINEISIYKALKESPYYRLIPESPFDDYLHTNSIELLTPDKAAGFSFLNAGDIMLSHLNLVNITVIDGKTFKVKWALTGVADNIHDADFLDNGRIAFFVNTAYHRGSMIVEWDCSLRQPYWWFTPIDYRLGISEHMLTDDIFLSHFAGMQQKLPNGNYLIVETTGGSIFEVTPEKRIVWKYVSTKLEGESIGMIFCAERYSPEDLPFLAHLNSN